MSNRTSLLSIRDQAPESEFQARILAALSVAMTAIMLLFLGLLLFWEPTLEGGLVIGGLLLVSLLTFISNRLGHLRVAAWLFSVGYSALIILSMFLHPTITSTAPYYLGVMVVLSGVLLGPAIPLLLATLATLAIGGMVMLAPPVVHEGPTPAWVAPVLVPAALLYLLAVVAAMSSAGTKRMINELQLAVQQVNNSIMVLGESVGHILTATTQVASSTAETASAVSETTATVGEVKQTVQVASQKAKFVVDSAQRAVQVAQGGRQSVDQTIQAMKRISEQMELIAQSITRLSEQGQAISEIIASVNDLAEQSNLLAVNAAIEAARAGEQGKGFGVVAQEVRNLAEQSKQATMQVRTILTDIQRATNAAVMATEQGSRTVEAGRIQVAQAGDSIRQLAASLDEAAQAATQIAASTHQQMVGMDQVAAAMENIKLASVQNVAGTQQSEQTARTLTELAEQLKVREKARVA
ncbi:MAG: hypothetical protein KF832_00710 [Caldilineaceae bacterium]|nr:hypothetical protein [Caldilineaceae bacterium]